MKIRFVELDRKCTRQFGHYVLEVSRRMTINDAARHLALNWTTVKEIEKRYLCRKFSRPYLRELRRIATDEISVGHSHRSLTVVLDLDSVAVVFVGEGKYAKALEPFWRHLKASGTKIAGLCPWTCLRPISGL